MKKIIVTIGLLMTQLFSHGQQFMNGNFNIIDNVQPDVPLESYTGYDPNLFNQWFPNCPWWGNLKNIKIGLNADSTYYPVISVTGMGNTNYYYDVLSLKLDSPLIIGQKYRIKFKEKYNVDVPITFESTYESGQYGNEIHTFQPQGNYLYEWRPLEFEFIAQDSAEYINVFVDLELGVEYNLVSLALDEFQLELINDEVTTDVYNHEINNLIKYDAYSLDGKLLFAKVYISELPSGVYILMSEKGVCKIIK